MMATAFGGLAAMSAGTQRRAADRKPVSSEDKLVRISKITSEWQRLLPLWREKDTEKPIQAIENLWDGPHGKAIIALGPGIIPYLIQQLRKGDFVFIVPLKLITNVDISNGKDSSLPDITIPEIAKLWLKWWDGDND